MKKALIATILGIAAAATTYGQGHVIFNTYVGTVYSPIKFLGGAQDGTTASAGFSAELYYGLGSGVAFSAMTPLPSTITAVTATGSLAGYVQGNDAIIPNYVSGPISFAIVAFNGTTWHAPNSTFETLPANVPTWTETSINPILNPTDLFQQNIPLITVSSVVPEPTTLALAGLGSAALLIFRRRNK